MTKAELYTLTTNLCGGFEMDMTLFEQFLDIAQMKIEGMRNWVILKNEDASQSIAPGESFTSAKNLPTGFLNWADDDSPIQLIDANGNPLGYREVPLSKKYFYKQYGGVFFVDYILNKLYICGTITQGYTIHQYFIKESPLVSAGNTWVFPERFQKILAFYAAIYWKLGVDYDVVSNTQGNNNASVANAIYDIMTNWDARLQEAQTRGLDPFNSDQPGGWQSGKMTNSI